MRLGRQRESSNVEDRRGVRFTRGGGIGLGGLVILLVGAYFGLDLSPIVQQGAPVQEQQVPYQESADEADARVLVSKVLADTEDAWGSIFAAAGRTYEQPTLVLFSEGVQTGCGLAPSAVGPFYCPADHKVYIDLSFYGELRRLGATGDFAQAYVIAHEVGHHVQTLLGISDRTMAARQRSSETDANALSVRQELQADCFAGIWAHNANESRQLLEAGDIEEGLNAASAIGDDRLSKGRAPPESFTHGTSAQRVSWFRRGYESGSLDECDTFGTRNQ
jgi:uncharacterized protein